MIALKIAALFLASTSVSSALEVRSAPAAMPVVAPARHSKSRASRVAQWVPRSLKRVLLVPEHKLMFCFIEKNACSQFNGLFNELNDITTDHLYFSSGAIDHFNWTEADIASTLKDPSWYKGVFLRDPMERLVSAFVSKCVPDDDGSPLEGNGSSCLFFEREVSEGSSPSFPSFVSTMAQKVGDEQKPECAWGTPSGCRRPKASDPHFMPQTQFCGGVDVDDYDYVGDLSQNMNAEVKRMLMDAGLGSRLLTVDGYFPPNWSGEEKALARPEHTLSHASNPAVLTKYYADSETRDLAYHMYAPDFAARTAAFEHQMDAGHHKPARGPL